MTATTLCVIRRLRTYIRSRGDKSGRHAVEIIIMKYCTYVRVYEIDYVHSGILYTDEFHTPTLTPKEILTPTVPFAVCFDDE